MKGCTPTIRIVVWYVDLWVAAAGETGLALVVMSVVTAKLANIFVSNVVRNVICIDVFTRPHAPCWHRALISSIVLAMV